MSFTAMNLSDTSLTAVSSRGCNPLARLARVEVQLIMQCCDRTSLLYLARCCKTLFVDASSDLVWRGRIEWVAIRGDIPIDEVELQHPPCGMRLNWKFGIHHPYTPGQTSLQTPYLPSQGLGRSLLRFSDIGIHRVAVPLRSVRSTQKRSVPVSELTRIRGLIDDVSGTINEGECMRTCILSIPGARLDVYAVTDHAITINTLKNITLQCPSVRMMQLVLWTSRLEPPHTALTTMPVFSHLEELSVQSQFDNPFYVHCWLQRMSECLPALRRMYLDISYFNQREDTDLWFSLFRAWSQLQYLSLMAMDHVRFLPMIDATMPRLETLELYPLAKCFSNNHCGLSHHPFAKSTSALVAKVHHRSLHPDSIEKKRKPLQIKLHVPCNVARDMPCVCDIVACAASYPNILRVYFQ